VAPQATPTAEPAGKQPSDDGGKVPVKVIADGDDMQLSLVSDHSQPVACDTPCLARVLPGRLSLLPPRGTDPQNVIIDGPTTVTLVPGSRPKLVGGIVLMVVGAALFAVAIGGGMSGDVGALPAIVLAAAGGGAMGGGGSLFSSSGGSVSVERGVK
jgi:hypothetical protein